MKDEMQPDRAPPAELGQGDVDAEKVVSLFDTDRLLRVANEEFGRLRPRMLAAYAAGWFLPQLHFNRVRTMLYRAAGVTIGARSLIMGDLTLSGEGDYRLLEIGRSSYITGPLRIDLGARVSIGNNVNIGQDCLLLTVSHETGTRRRRAGSEHTAPIVIEDGVWLASRVTILPGCTIGRGSVVAAGAVVTGDVPRNVLVGGVPAKPIRDLDPT